MLAVKGSISVASLGFCFLKLYFQFLLEKSVLCGGLNALIIDVQICSFVRNFQGFEQGSVLLVRLIQRSIIGIFSQFLGETKLEFILFSLFFVLNIYLELLHHFLLVIYVFETL